MLRTSEPPSSDRTSVYSDTFPKPPLMQKYCENRTLEDCVKLDCDSLHFEKTINRFTDETLGDCSYLNTCHREGCRFVHYRTPMTPCDDTGEMHPDTNALYLNADVRELKFDKLGKFAVIICDPPWTIRQSMPYSSLTDNEFCKLSLGQLQTPGDLIFLWTTGRVVDYARRCLISWGYENIEDLVWVKVNQLQRPVVTGRTGHWLNHSKETCLVARKRSDSPTARPARVSFELNYICSEVRDTSHKPDELYGLAEKLVGEHGRKLEIFARSHNVRPGWHFIGDQIRPEAVPKGVTLSKWVLDN